LPQHKAEYIEAIHHVSHQIYQRPSWGQAHISFNGKLREECLSLEWFRSRREASVIICQRRLNSDPLSVDIVGVNLTHPGS